MKRIVLSLALALVLMPAVAEAASLNLYRRQVLAGPAESSVEDTLLFEEAPSTLELPIFSTLSKFEARSTLSNHTCEAGEKGYGSLITCELPEGESGRLSLEFTTKGFVRETGKHYYFQDDFDTPYQTENMVYNAKLKEGLVLIDEDMETPFDRFSPSYGEEGSDGRRIYIVWSEENVSPGEGIQVSMSFEKTTRENGISLEVLIVITGVVLVALLLVLGANIGKGEEGSLPEALKDDERKTMEIIENSGGQIKQKRIVDAVDFSKAKVSRLVHDLKERGLLETEKVGRTNRVKLKEGN